MSVSVVPPLAQPYLARELVRREMLAWLRLCRSEKRPCLMNLHGLEGLGVSSLATQFHRDNRREIDGPLVWLAGRAADGTANTPSQLLGQILVELGVPDSEQSASEAERASACRRQLAGKACMVVVDDLAAKAQIERLLSLDAPGFVLVVTTPFSRRDLRAEKFRPFAPEFLAMTDARDLFLDGCADAGSIAETTIDGLLTMCGGLPLLIKVLAAQLDGRPGLADALLAELRDARLDLLSLDDERRMRGFFDIAYARLPETEAAAYRRLALVPGPDFGVDVAAACVEQPVSTTHLVLERLVDHNVLVAPSPGRYTFHPVVRADARARASAVDDHDVRREVVRRAVTWYLREAMTRTVTMSGRWWVPQAMTVLRELAGENPATHDHRQTEDWLRAELPNLVASVTAADQYGLPELTWPMCIALWKYLHVHGLYVEWITTHQVALAAARRLGEPAVVMQVASQLGSAHLGLGETAPAGEYFAESLAAARTAGNALGEQSAIEWRGKIAAAEKRYADALADYSRSHEFAVAHKDEIGADQLARVDAVLRLQEARARNGLRDWAGARSDAEAAVVYFDTRPNETDNRAKSRFVLGEALYGLHATERAADVLFESLALFEVENALKPLADVCVLLADVVRDLGRADEAQALLLRALQLYEHLGDETGARNVRNRLSPGSA